MGGLGEEKGVPFSTKESAERQNVENQLRELREFCNKQRWVIVGEYQSGNVTGN